MDMQRFSGRVAVVTGAGGGLGSAVSEELVKAGMIVAGVDVNAKPVEELAARLGPAGQLHALVGDISREEDLQRVFQWVEDKLGGIAVLVNNAGRVVFSGTKDLKHHDAEQVVNTNVLGVIASCTKALQSMKKHNITDGHIINVSSTVGHPTSVTLAWVDKFHSGVYCASKHAVTGLSRALRAEVRALPGYRIRVTNLSPGSTRTPLMTPEQVEMLEGRVMEPEDVARAVRFALSSPPGVEVSELTIQPTGEVW